MYRILEFYFNTSGFIDIFIANEHVEIHKNADIWHRQEKKKKAKKKNTVVLLAGSEDTHIKLHKKKRI